MGESVHNRRLVVLAAFVAAGVGIATSGTAQAAAPSSKPASPAANAVGLDAIKQLPAKTYDSAADRTVVTAKPGARAAAPAQGAPAAAPLSATIGIGLRATLTSAHGVDLETQLTPSATGTVAVTIAWGDGTSDTFNAGIAGGGLDKRVTKHKYTSTGRYDVKVTATDTANAVEATNTLSLETLGSEFTPVAPARLLDTRWGVGAPAAKVPARGTVALKIDGAGQIPAGVDAVVLNVTVTNATADGHVSVQPTKTLAETAETSNLNFVAGQTVPNLVVATVGYDGYVYLFNSSFQSVDLLADVTGYFAAKAASGYKSVTQTRVVDTRSAIGAPLGQVPGLSSFDVQMTGRNGVPAGVTAVAVNLTATGPQDAGHLIAYPTGQAVPTTSNLNFTGGQTVANAAIVPVGADGKITIRNGSWKPTDVVLDIVGYYTPASRSALVPIGKPLRLLDTRLPDGSGKPTPITARNYIALSLEGDTTTPRFDGYVFNTTVTNTAGPGFLSVNPDPNFWSAYLNGTAVTPDRPVSSTLNWTAGQTVPNLTQSSSGKGSVIDFWNQGWQNADLLVDLQAYYESN
ncbi:PKD domain-containing protein [Kitasatospora sp. NPDC056651]|uniref:PKD domain-containing protein n=1 Tax=Kitasatospora sp. NPDC056651 TaxID=3345892 RepID=UPI0036ACCCBF